MNAPALKRKWTYALKNAGNGFIVRDADDAMICDVFMTNDSNIAKRRASIIALAPDLSDVVEALLLFHSVDWTQEKRYRWHKLTGHEEATTKVLCDFARSVLAQMKKELT